MLVGNPLGSNSFAQSIQCFSVTGKTNLEFAAALPRRSTKGPLDADDPLSDSPSLTVSSADPSASPLAASTELEDSLSAPLTASQNTDISNAHPQLSTPSKDLSFLLDASIYHPLSNIDVPPPFRQPLPSTPSIGRPLNNIFVDLTDLLQKCHFLGAAHLAAIVLTSGLVQPTDTASIFRLLSIRYSALELSGNVVLAAQESKALEDLSSSFYYEDPPVVDNTSELPGSQRPVLKHIMPFDLRLQALRLQGIGFSDSRRAVGAFFDLGMECRDNLMKDGTDGSAIWRQRLLEVGVRVVNTLVDMGDFDCARRTLWSMRPEEGDPTMEWASKMALLLIKMGEVSEARKIIEHTGATTANHTILQSLIETSDGNLDKSVELLSNLSEGRADQDAVAVAKQNLAVVYLYTGEIQKSRRVLEKLADQGYSFQTLTVNLATMYDLMSDKSTELKTDLANKIAHQGPKYAQRSFVNADFKL